MKRILFDETALTQAFEAVGRGPMTGVLQAMVSTCLLEAEAVAEHLRGGALMEARRTAHGIAGAAGNCSAIALEHDARRIAHGKSPDPDDGAALVETARATALWLSRHLTVEDAA